MPVDPTLQMHVVELFLLSSNQWPIYPQVTLSVSTSAGLLLTFTTIATDIKSVTKLNRANTVASVINN